jgi:hypothetical protein
MNTYSGLCMGACIFMIFFGLASSVVNSIGAFPSSPTIDTTAAQGSYDVGTYIWIGGSVSTLLLAIAIGITTKSTNLIALTAFGGTFWTSWLAVLPIFNNFGFSANATGSILIFMLTLGMSVMFIGAVIGILSPGSTAMR